MTRAEARVPVAWRARGKARASLLYSIQLVAYTVAKALHMAHVSRFMRIVYAGCVELVPGTWQNSWMEDRR